MTPTTLNSQCQQVTLLNLSLLNHSSKVSASPMNNGSICDLMSGWMWAWVIKLHNWSVKHWTFLLQNFLSESATRPGRYCSPPTQRVPSSLVSSGSVCLCLWTTCILAQYFVLLGLPNESLLIRGSHWLCSWETHSSAQGVRLLLASSLYESLKLSSGPHSIFGSGGVCRTNKFT